MGEVKERGKLDVAYRPHRQPVTFRRVKSECPSHFGIKEINHLDHA